MSTSLSVYETILDDAFIDEKNWGLSPSRGHWKTTSACLSVWTDTFWCPPEWSQPSSLIPNLKLCFYPHLHYFFVCLQKLSRLLSSPTEHISNHGRITTTAPDRISTLLPQNNRVIVCFSFRCDDVQPCKATFQSRFRTENVHVNSLLLF